MHKMFLFILAGAALLLQYGCGIFAYPGMYIVHPDKNEKIFIPIKKDDDSVFREIICWSDAQRKLFKTLQKQSETSAKIKTYGLNGKLLQEQSIPFVPESFTEATRSYIFTPDGEKLIFCLRQDEQYSLYEYDFRSQRKRLLWQNMGSIVHIQQLYFINNSHLVLFLTSDGNVGRKTDQVVFFDLQNNQRRVLFADLNLPFFYAFSPDRQRVAFKTGHQEITIIDMIKPRLQKIYIKSVSRISKISWMNNAEIAVTGESLASENIEQVVIYHLPSGKITPILDLKLSKRNYISKLFALEHDKLLVNSFDYDACNSIYYYYLIDIPGKRIIKTFNFYSPAPVWSVDKDTIIFESLTWSFRTYYFFNDREISTSTLY